MSAPCGGAGTFWPGTDSTPCARTSDVVPGWARLPPRWRRRVPRLARATSFVALQMGARLTSHEWAGASCAFSPARGADTGAGTEPATAAAGSVKRNVEPSPGTPLLSLHMRPPTAATYARQHARPTPLPL